MRSWKKKLSSFKHSKSPNLRSDGGVELAKMQHEMVATRANRNTALEVWNSAPQNVVRLHSFPLGMERLKSKSVQNASIILSFNLLFDIYNVAHNPVDWSGKS